MHAARCHPSDDGPLLRDGGRGSGGAQHRGAFANSSDDDVGHGRGIVLIQAGDYLLAVARGLDRFKALGQFARLPKRDDESNRAWLLRELLLAPLMEKLISHGQAVSPWG